MNVINTFGKSETALELQATYIHNQVGSSATWTVQHKLGKYPSIICVDNGENIIGGDVVFDSKDQITITFNEAISGKAYLN